jgi:glycerophosphoryl diester phosphodiesterase
LSYPDNTLEGIVAAAESVDFVELDVRRSADGRMVLSHEPELGELIISDHSWDELSAVELGDGYRPTLLDAVMEALPEFPLNIEIKNFPAQPGFDPDGTFAVEVAAFARPFDLVTSFYWPTVDSVKAAFPAVRTGLLVYQVGSLSDTIRAATSGGHRAIAPHFSLLIEGPVPLIEKAHSAGLEVLTWTVNDSEMAASLVSAGIDAIISDDPVRIQQEIQ